MKRRTRFSLADLMALKAEAEAARETLRQLSRHLSEANLTHTGSGFHDSDVRRVSDRLYGQLNQVESLLYRDHARHGFATLEEKSA